MFTIMDYAKYYKNIPITTMGMNESDILVMTIISYMPIEAFIGDKSFDEVMDLILSSDYSKPLWLMAPKVRDMAELLKGSKRYESMVISDFSHIINEKTQFGALTFTYDGNKIIAYEGSDGTSTGWFENFRVAYIYPTVTQKLAVEYLKEHTTLSDTSVYIAGHSKGGNLAIAAAMESEYKENIKTVYNFDGPGFQLSEIESDNFISIKDKIHNIIPEGSYLGCLLHNTGEYLVIKSNEKGFYIHYPTSWEVFGGFLVTESEMSDISRYLHTLTTKGFDRVDHEEAKNVLEGSFKALELQSAAKFKISFKGFIRAMDSIHKSDEGVRQFIRNIVAMMWLATKKKNISLEEIKSMKKDKEN